MQAFDYAALFGEGVRLDSGTFGTTYYTLTGFHGAHVFGGVLMLAVVLYRGRWPASSQPPPRHGRGDVDVLALRRRRLDPAVLDPVHPVSAGEAMLRSMIPRIAILIGLLFIIVGACTVLADAGTAQIVDYAGITMLLALGVAMSCMFYVLVAGSPRGADHARMLEDIWTQLLDLHHPVRRPRLGRAGRAPPDRARRPGLPLPHLDHLPDRRPPRPKRRGVRRLTPVAPAGLHMPGPTFAPLFGAVGAFLLVFGLVAGGIALWLGADRADAHAPVLGPRGDGRLRPHPRGRGRRRDRRDPARRRPRRATAGRAHAGTLVPPHPRRDRLDAPRLRLRRRRLVPGRRGDRADHHPAGLAPRRPPRMGGDGRRRRDRAHRERTGAALAAADVPRDRRHRRRRRRVGLRDPAPRLRQPPGRIARCVRGVRCAAGQRRTPGPAPRPPVPPPSTPMS